MKPCLLYLTCQDDFEADKISDSLLKQRLVVCIKKMNCNSSFLWNLKKNEAKEVLLVMDSEMLLFSKIESAIRKIHSYEQFVLIAVPVLKTSKGIKEWMKKELVPLRK